MPSVDVVVNCPVHDSFRVQQVAGMFDVPLTEKASERFQVELPDANEDWQIGLIVGPSGSGKSTIARRAFAERLYDSAEWPVDRAVIDGFGDLPVRNVVDLFTAVGFGSPPSWVKPYHVLSNGERFRCDLARALAVGFHKAATVGRGLCARPTTICSDFYAVAPFRDPRSRLYDGRHAANVGLPHCDFRVWIMVARRRPRALVGSLG
jgi:hypothetical protein